METQPTCRDCGVALTPENWYRYHRERIYKGQHMRLYICKRCFWQKQKAYRKKKCKYFNKHQNEYKRVHEIEINGKTYRSKNIIRPSVCSICGGNTGRGIQFHHFTQKPLTGLWVCLRCHNIIHAGRCGRFQKIENWFKRYQELKANPVVISL
jgi:protein-arginine kinase activator protein McsA